MLRTTITRSAENLSASKIWLRKLKLEAEQAPQSNQPRTCHRTWLKILRLVAMVMVVIMKRLKRSSSRKSSGPMGYLTFLRSNADNASFKKIWVSFDSFWPLLELWVKGTFWKAIKQSSHWATQSFYSNQFLQKLTLHRYNKLSSCQVCRTYKLFLYHPTSIIKLQLLGISTSLSGISSLSLTT